MSLAFKKEVDVKSHPWFPCIQPDPSTPMLPTTGSLKRSVHYVEKEMWEVQGYRSAPCFHSSTFRFESRRAFHAPLLYFISPLSHSPTFIPSHWLPPHTKYIYYPAVCCRWAPLAGFPLLGRMQETRRRERKEEKEIRVSNSVRQPLRVVRLMAAKLSTTLINMHLS